MPRIGTLCYKVVFLLSICQSLPFLDDADHLLSPASHSLATIIIIFENASAATYSMQWFCHTSLAIYSPRLPTLSDIGISTAIAIGWVWASLAYDLLLCVDVDATRFQKPLLADWRIATPARRLPPMRFMFDSLMGDFITFIIYILDFVSPSARRQNWYYARDFAFMRLVYLCSWTLFLIIMMVMLRMPAACLLARILLFLF